MRTLSQDIKARAKQHGINVKTSKHGNTITVTLLASCPDSALEDISSLATLEAHGDLQDDTRWYSGVSIQYRSSFNLSEQDEAAIKAILASWHDFILRETNTASLSYHIEEQIKTKLNRSVAMAYLDKQNMLNVILAIKESEGN